MTTSRRPSQVLGMSSVRQCFGLLPLLLLAGAASANLTDDFGRADGATIGNGWVEKAPAAFSIQGGTATKVAAGGGYLDNLVYRPSTEDVLDVEASAEFRIVTGSPGYPQIHVRVQSATAVLTNWLDSYVLFIDGSNAGAVLGRQRGSSFVTTLADIPLSPALNTTDTFRLRLRATGTSPVQLSAYVERRSGAAWQIVGQASVNDSSTSRITTAGSVGFSGYLETAYRFDNFVRTNLVAPPPPPPPAELMSLSPISAAVGSSNTVVTINGTGFTTASVGRWNGQARTTSFVSSNQIRVTLLSADLSTDRIGAITVATGSTVTAPLPFFVLPMTDMVFFDNFNRGPSADVGNGWIEKLPSAFEILASGVLWADNTEPNQYLDTMVYRPLSEEQLDVETGVEFVRAAGARFPQVHARIQGDTVALDNLLESYILYVEDGLTPQGLAIAVQPPVYSMGECIIGYATFPTLPQVGVRYRIRLQARGTYPVALTGIMESFNPATGAWENFVTASVVHDNSTPDLGIYCPYTTVPAPIQTAGTVGVAKWYDRTDGYDNFYWRAVAPSNVPNVSSVSPGSVVAGSTALVLTVTGSNFNSGSTVRWNGLDRPTTLISSTLLQAAISESDVSATGTAAITVFNAGTGGGVSPQSRTLTITAPPTVQFSDNFNRPDGDIVGNGWIEKTPASFSIQDNRLRKLAFVTDYLNSVVYRPGSESLLNSEVSAEVRILNLSVGWPQIFARLQPGTVTTPNSLDGYIFYLDGSPQRAILGRQRGSAFLTELATVTLSEPVNLVDTYRLRLRVSGTTSVQLDALVERLIPGGAWLTIGQASATDVSAQRISTPGVAGIGSYVEDYYSYDNVTIWQLN